MNTIVTGLFESPKKAAGAVRALESRGFMEQEISLIANDRVGAEEFEVDSHSKLPEGIALGATAGGAVGALAAGLTGIGAVTTGGVGLLAAGPLAAALAGAGAGAAGGGAVGGLIGAAIPEHEVKHYEREIEKGSVAVCAQCDSARVAEVARITFKECQAKRISHV